MRFEIGCERRLVRVSGVVAADGDAEGGRGGGCGCAHGVEMEGCDGCRKETLFKIEWWEEERDAPSVRVRYLGFSIALVKNRSLCGVL